MREENKNCDFCKEKMNCNDESLAAYIEDSELLFKALKVGRIRGIVNIAGCKNAGFELDEEAARLIRKLMGMDILVTVSGCAVSALDDAGLMGADALKWAGDGLTDVCEHLGIVPVFHLGLSDGSELYPLLSGHVAADIEALPLAAMTLHHGRNPLPEMPVSKMEEVYGAVFSMEEGPEEAVELIDAHIHRKRLKLDWCDRLHCSMETYS